MKQSELALRTFLLLLAVILTLQIKDFVPIEKILLIYGIAFVVTALNMVLFNMLGLTDNK